MIDANHYYGHSDILRKYCDLDTAPLLAGRLQHGWDPVLGTHAIHFKEPWPDFIWSRRNLTTCAQQGLRAVPIGAPALYLPPVQNAAPSEPKSLLAYPFHGWEKQRLHGDLGRYGDALEELVADGFGPVTVCLYWLEHDDPEIRDIFVRKGFSVVTNGHRDDNLEFLINQRQSLLDHAYVTSNRVCTAAFYALAFDRPFFLHGPPAGVAQSKDPTGEQFAAWQQREFPMLCRDKFNGAPLREIGERELGMEFKRSPEQLRELLMWNDADRHRRSWWRARLAAYRAMPWLYALKARKPKVT